MTARSASQHQSQLVADPDPQLVVHRRCVLAGFGVMHSMIFNQIGGMLALGNGLLPLRKAAQLREAKERRTLTA